MSDVVMTALFSLKIPSMKEGLVYRVSVYSPQLLPPHSRPHSARMKPPEIASQAGTGTMALLYVWTVHFPTMSSSSSPQLAGFVFLRWKPLLNDGIFPSHVRNPFSHVSLSVANILLFCLVTSSLEASLSVC